MASSPKDILSPVQWDFLTLFFQGSPPFFLTGGTALSAFYLRHRYSQDLDLFTLDSEAFDRAPLYMADSAAKLTALADSLQTAPQFRRYRLSRGEQSVIVDFVREVAPQISEQKNRIEGITVDTLEEITANKICALLSRAEIKDYVDLYFLDRAGYPLEKHIEAAQKKDAGVSKSALAYVLSEVSFSKVPDFMIASLSLADLQKYFKSLAQNLAVESFPQ
ncbi:MAG: nucleotidyl transferase AbiEii/AbiGii toxin family protein [Candidatus Binatia bacterium]